MRKPTDYYAKALAVLEELHSSHPSCSLGKHLSTAFDDISPWGLTDREVYDAINAYSDSLDYDVPHPEEEELDKIIEDGKHVGELINEIDQYNGEE